MPADTTPIDHSKGVELLFQLGEQQIAEIKRRIAETTRQYNEEIQRLERELQALTLAQEPLRAWMTERLDSNALAPASNTSSVRQGTRGDGKPRRSRKKAKRTSRGDIKPQIVAILERLGEADTGTMVKELGTNLTSREVSSKLNRIAAKGTICKEMKEGRAFWMLPSSKLKTEPESERPSVSYLHTAAKESGPKEVKEESPDWLASRDADSIASTPATPPVTPAIDPAVPDDASHTRGSLEIGLEIYPSYPKSGSYADKVIWGIGYFGGETPKPALEDLLISIEPEMNIRNLRPTISTMISAGRLLKIPTGPGVTDYILRVGTPAER